MNNTCGLIVLFVFFGLIGFTLGTLMVCKIENRARKEERERCKKGDDEKMKKESTEQCLNYFLDFLEIGISGDGKMVATIRGGTEIAKKDLTKNIMQTKDVIIRLFNTFMCTASQIYALDEDEMSLEEFYNKYHEDFDALDGEDFGNMLGWMNLDLLRFTIENAVEEYIKYYNGSSARDFVTYKTDNEDIMRWLLDVKKTKKSKRSKRKKAQGSNHES